MFLFKTFSQKQHLNSQIRIRTKEKPFECLFCCKTFSQKCNLNRHIRIHTKKSCLNVPIVAKRFLKNNS